jgi:flagellar basal-body rod modification protein FlgD
MTSVITPTIATTTPTSSSSSTASTIAGAQSSLAGDQQTFFKLLTAQLQNQDPLSPVDSNAFTQQLVAMTGVQQQIVTNQLLQQMVQNQGGIADPVALIGKTVTSSSATAAIQGGQANWDYSLAVPAAGVQLQVTDSRGNVVATTTLGPQAAGEHAFNWNGKDLAGTQLSDGGAYTLQVSATSAAGGGVTSQIYQRGTATAVQQVGGSSMITLNGGPVPLSSITTVAAGS